MAVSGGGLYLVCYDIADPKRLARVHRLVARRALMVQYSVYLARLRRRELEALREEIAARIREGEDDVRIYPLPEDARWVMLDADGFSGLPGLPEVAILSEVVRE